MSPLRRLAQLWCERASVRLLTVALCGIAGMVLGELAPATSLFGIAS